MGTADVHVYVEYARKAQHNVIVHYVEQGTTNELATQATAVTKYEDEAYDISSSALLNKDDIASWSRVGVRSEDTSKLSGTMGTADIHVYVEYARKAQHNVTVYYWDVTDSENPVALSVNGKTSDSIVKYEDESYNVTDLTNIPVANYQEPVVATGSDPLSGTMGTEDLVIHVNYAKISDLSYTIEYYYVGEDAPFDTETVENVIHGTQVEDVVDSDALAKGFKRDHVEGTPVEITENGIVIKVYYVEKEPTDVEIPVTHIYYTDKLDGSTVKDGSQPGSSLVISVSEARETIVNLDEVGRLLTYGGNNYDFVSIRVVGTLKDEFKKPAVPVDDKLPEELDEELEEEVPATTEDIAWLDEEIDVLSTTPDAGALVPTAVLAPTVEYTSDFTHQPEYDYEIELIYSKDEPKPEPKPDPEPDDDDDDDDNTTTTIDDPTVPLAPAPNNLVTILDPNMPLGNLPQTGGAGRLAAGAGLIGMLGAVLNLFRKKKDD